MDSISNSRERKLQWPWNSIDLKLLNFKTALNSEQERHLINVLGLVFYKQPVYKQIAPRMANCQATFKAQRLLIKQ